MHPDNTHSLPSQVHPLSLVIPFSPTLPNPHQKKKQNKNIEIQFVWHIFSLEHGQTLSNQPLKKVLPTCTPARSPWLWRAVHFYCVFIGQFPYYKTLRCVFWQNDCPLGRLWLHSHLWYIDINARCLSIRIWSHTLRFYQYDSWQMICHCLNLFPER